MTILVNTNHNIKGGESFKLSMMAQIEDELSRFATYITRIEAHLTDENAHKQGQNDKRCVLEAHVEHRAPVAVTSHANTYEQAMDAAIDKLKSALDTVIGKMKQH